MRSMVLVATVLLIACVVPVAALELDLADNPPNLAEQLNQPEKKADVPSGAVIGGKSSKGAILQRCVEVQIGGETTYNCLNDELMRKAKQFVPSYNLPPIDARSSDIKTGIVNIPALKQQYGPNYGVSVRPYRPALPVYSSPLRPQQ
jgi:hypothetical protein